MVHAATYKAAPKLKNTFRVQKARTIANKAGTTLKKLPSISRLQLESNPAHSVEELRAGPFHRLVLPSLKPLSLRMKTFDSIGLCHI
jgi:hypothetical protein